MNGLTISINGNLDVVESARELHGYLASMDIDDEIIVGSEEQANIVVDEDLLYHVSIDGSKDCFLSAETAAHTVWDAIDA